MQTEVNKAIRLLEGEKRKYTSIVLLKSGNRLELQHDHPLLANWQDGAREVCLLLRLQEYSDYHVVCRWGEVEAIQTEENK